LEEKKCFFEKREVYVDVFCCSDSFDPQACMREIEKAFGGKANDWKVVER